MDDSSWIRILTRPRAKIQSVLAAGHHRHVLVFAALSGAGGLVVPGRYLFRLDLGWHLLAIATAGPAIGILGMYLGAGLLKWSAYWLGGSGSARSLRAALAWASIPAILIAPVDLAALLVYGKLVFYPPFPGAEETAGFAFARVLVTVLAWVAFLWGTVLSVACIGQVQGLSFWRVLVTIGIAVGILMLAGLAVAGFALLANVSILPLG